MSPNELDSSTSLPPDPGLVVANIRSFGRELGFQDIGIAGIDLRADEAHLDAWLALNRHGEMAYMEKHGRKRSRPEALRPGTISVIVARMNYLKQTQQEALDVLQDHELGYISRYALGRDYHKLMRSRLKKLGQKIEAMIGEFGYRVFTDSAPVLERALARKGGLGWFGKHANLIDRKDGSWFFLGEIYTDLPLPLDEPYSQEHCGRCVACLDACPTRAIVAPYEVDARLCISYLTIELKGAIPNNLRALVGNRIFGCDDCQLVCPWNRFAGLSVEPDFAARHQLDKRSLLDLYAWSEETFLRNTEGSAIRRISYEQWQRNIAVALGNAPRSAEILASLQASLSGASDLLKDHIEWAIARQRES